jgi:type II secretion system protein L
MMVAHSRSSRMTTLRIRLSAPCSPDRADAWALFDAAGACMRMGRDRPGSWPDAARVEIVLAASQLRIASVTLPQMPPARLPGAAGFALEDQLAGPVGAHHVAVSSQASDGRVRAVIAARSLLSAITASNARVERIVAEPDLAVPQTGWRWCAGDDDGVGFVTRPDGSALPVDAPSGDGPLPAELSLALEQARRDGVAPPHVRVDAVVADAALARWQRDTGVAFARGTPWRWHAAAPAAFAAAINLAPDAASAAATTSRLRPGRAFAPAMWLAGTAVALHVVATVGEWTSLRIDDWRASREWTALAIAAGVTPDAAATPAMARDAIGRRYAAVRHAHGLPAPDDALPLLAKAAPALAALPADSVKSATYADGHWTVDLARAEPAAVHDLDARMRAAGVPALVAMSATGARVRFGGP